MLPENSATLPSATMSASGRCLLYGKISFLMPGLVQWQSSVGKKKKVRFIITLSYMILNLRYNHSNRDFFFLVMNQLIRDRRPASLEIFLYGAANQPTPRKMTKYSLPNGTARKLQRLEPPHHRQRRHWKSNSDVYFTSI